MSRHHGTAVRSRATQRAGVGMSFDRVRPIENPTGVKGGFRITLADGTWWWSPGMFTLHGYRPDEMPRVRPSTRLVLAHRHPDDRKAMANAWAHLIADGRLVALHYRVLGADGITRAVFALASTDHHRKGRPTAVTGVLQLEA
jgi:PAS domain-containing protein